jgi:hypothetical protein
MKPNDARLPLKTGLEQDVVYGRKLYCYLKNRPKNVSFAKRSINRRRRHWIKRNLYQHLE